MEEPISSYPFSPEEYPGKIPSFSFFLSKDFVHELHIDSTSLSKAVVDYKKRKIELSLLFEELSLKQLRDRYAVLGYGSNACPTRLIDKGVLNLPIVKVSARNIDVVYAYEKTNYGAIPATIARSLGALSKIWICFLDEDQLQKMDDSEGRKSRQYDLTELKKCIIMLPNGLTVSPVYAYVANKKGVALKSDQPIALASIYAKNRRFKYLYEREMLHLISSCKKGDPTEYLDFEAIPLERFPEKFNNSRFQGIILDPTIFNDSNRIRSFLRSTLSNNYTIAIASDVFFMIKEERWKELSKLLKNWEWNIGKEKMIRWHESQEFRALCKDVIGLIAPCSWFLKDLNENDREIQRKLSEMLEPSSPRIIKIAKELLMTSVIKRFPILSYTKHAKRWFKNCRNVMLMEITDAKNSVSYIKRNIKIEIEESGWYGYIMLFIFGLSIDRSLESLLPPPIGTLIGEISGGSFIVGVVINGKKIEY